LIAGSWIHVSKLQYTKKIAPNKMGGGEYKSKCLTIMDLLIRDRPFNLKGGGGGGWGFLFRSEFFFRTTQELEYLFCRAKREFFFQNLTLGYMTKTLNQIIFFSSTKIRIFFSATLGIRIFFFRKKP
jgi:hypothetical protein